MELYEKTSVRVYQGILSYVGRVRVVSAIENEYFRGLDHLCLTPVVIQNGKSTITMTLVGTVKEEYRGKTISVAIERQEVSEREERYNQKICVDELEIVSNSVIKLKNKYLHLGSLLSL